MLFRYGDLYLKFCFYLRSNIDQRGLRNYFSNCGRKIFHFRFFYFRYFLFIFTKLLNFLNFLHFIFILDFFLFLFFVLNFFLILGLNFILFSLAKIMTYDLLWTEAKCALLILTLLKPNYSTLIILNNIFCLTWLWLMLNPRRVTPYAFVISHFPLKQCRLIILNFMPGNLVHYADKAMFLLRIYLAHL